MNTDDVVDILIIGAGASGAAAAWRLADAGFRVVCLEQGGWHQPEEYGTAIETSGSSRIAASRT